MKLSLFLSACIVATGAAGIFMPWAAGILLVGIVSLLAIAVSTWWYSR